MRASLQSTNSDFEKCEHLAYIRVTKNSHYLLDREYYTKFRFSISRKKIDLTIYFSISLNIAVQPPRQQVTHLNKKPVLQQGPQTEDEIRKWTEKKRRSKSLPRGGSEIDEILGK